MGITEILRIVLRETAPGLSNWRFWLVVLLCLSAAFLLQTLMFKLARSQVARWFFVATGAGALLLCELAFQFHAGRRLLILMLSYGFALCFLAGVLLAVLFHYLIKKRR